MKYLIKTFLIGSFIFAQTPADSLISGSETTSFQKLFLYPIARWQNLSYSNDDLNCQFHPSCSNYSAQAITKKGAIPGIIMTSDRIIRCNNYAYESHQKSKGSFHFDGRLNDPVILNRKISSSKSPYIAAGLSMVVPGLGRFYGGRPYDGMFGFIITSLALRVGINQIKEESSFSPLFASIGLTIYTGEIYGAYRTAKHYTR